jgi:hypothetical protein
MSEKRTTIRLNEHTLGVIDKAKGMWPEHDDNLSELIRQIIADWDRIREGDGNGTRAQTLKHLVSIKGDTQKILGRLGTDEHDTDHG